MIGSFIGSSEVTRSRNRRQSEDWHSHHEDEEEEEKSIVHLMMSNIYVFCFLVYGTWIALGILFYSHFEGWTPATAFYFAMEAGLSIGFCQPAEKSDWSKLFTIFYVLIGSSCVSACLGALCSTVISTKVHLEQDYDLERMTIRDINGDISLRNLFFYCWFRFKLNIGWYTDRARTITVTAWIFWTSLGTAYGMVFEKWSFITSLYWAICSAATGGLQSAPCDNMGDDRGYHCDMGTVRGTLMGVYFMIGVPIYACTMAQLARYVVSAAVAHRNNAVLKKPIEENEFLFAARILSSEDSETLILGEYILLELLRSGQTDQSQIMRMKKAFFELDKRRLGELDLDTLRESGKVITKPPRPATIAQRFRTSSVELFESLQQSMSPKRKSHREGDEESETGIEMQDRLSVDGRMDGSRRPSIAEDGRISF